MVTPQEARQQLQTAQTQLGMQRQILEAEKLRVQQTAPQTQTQEQLRGSGIMAMVKRRIEQTKLKKRRIAATQKLGVAEQELMAREQQLGEFEQKVSEAESAQASRAAEQREWDYAQELAKEGKEYMTREAPKSVQQKLQQILEGRAIKTESYKKMWEKELGKRMGELGITTQELTPEMLEVPAVAAKLEPWDIKFKELPEEDFISAGLRLAKESEPGGIVYMPGEVSDKFEVRQRPKHYVEDYIPFGRIKEGAKDYFEKVQQPMLPLVGGGEVPTPQPLTMEPPKPWIERKIGGAVTRARQVYAKLFEPGVYDPRLSYSAYEPVTPWKAAADVSQAGIITLPRIAGRVAGVTAEEAARFAGIPKEGYSYTTPEVIVPQRVTIGGEFIMPERETRVFTPTGIGKATEFVGTIAPYAFVPSGALLAGGVATAFGPSESYRPLGTRIEAGFLSGVGAVSLGSRAFRPKIIGKRLAREPFTRTAQVSYVDPYGKRLSRFVRYGYRPETELKVTTPIREFFGMKPKFDWTPVTKPQVDVLRPALGLKGRFEGGEWFVAGDTPYLAEVGRVSKVPYRATKEQVFELATRGKLTPSRKYIPTTGKGEVISFEQIPKLPKPERKVFESFLGKPMVTTEEAQLAQARISSYDWTKPVGKRTQQFYIGMETTPFKIVPDKFPIKFFKTTEAYKDITKPFYRVPRKVPKSPGILAEIPVKKFPSMIEYDITKAKFVPVKLKAKLSKKGVSQVLGVKQVQETPLIPPSVGFPKPKATKLVPPKPRVEPMTKSLVGIPRMVGGLGLTETQIKKAQGTMAIIDIPEVTLKAKVSPVVKVAPVEMLGLKPGIKLKSILKTKLKSILKTVLKPALKPMTALKPLTKIKTTLKTQMALRPALKTKSALKPTLRPTLKVTPKIIPRAPPPPRIPKRVVPWRFGEIQDTLRRPRRKPRGLFVAEVRRRGRFIPIGGPEPFLKAVKRGKRRVRETLAASLRIREIGRGIIPVVPSPIGFFRPAKREAGVLVQRKRKRLVSPLEVTEIKAARRKRKEWWQ